MKTYLFRTSATIKPIDEKKWWIDRDIVPNTYINAENTKEALEEYIKRLEDEHYIYVSKNALKTKEAMYVDDRESGHPMQIGYVMTAKTNFDNNGFNWVEKYIDLWIEISIITIPEFTQA